MSNNKYKVLIIEDDATIIRFVETVLSTSNYQVITATNGLSGERMASSHNPDLIVLDLGLPDMDGLELIEHVRENSTVPILVLSARSHESDKVAALDRGANDYVTKPFGIDEFLARVRALLRTSRHCADSCSVPGGRFVLKDLVIDYDKRLVTMAGEDVKLTQTEYNILALLSEYAGKVLTYSVISPLLANIYLNTLDRLWEKYGLTHGNLVRYADDTVIICKNKKSANHALNLLQYIMAKLDLKLHPVKTKIVSMWDGKEGFDFLGMHHRRMTTETSKGQLYKETYQYPSRKAMKKMKAEIKKTVNGRSLLVAKEEDLIKNLNPKITGWKNYYSTKTNEKWMQALDWYIICTFTRWYNKKHQRRKHMSRVGLVRTSIYEKGLKKMARA